MFDLLNYCREYKTAIKVIFCILYIFSMYALPQNYTNFLSQKYKMLLIKLPQPL